jgi:hypothetical protein
MARSLVDLIEIITRLPNELVRKILGYIPVRRALTVRYPYGYVHPDWRETLFRSINLYEEDLPKHRGKYKALGFGDRAKANWGYLQ